MAAFSPERPEPQRVRPTSTTRPCSRRSSRDATPRLGDAILAAQGAYADTGALPELLSIYHLFGDPALMLWPESAPPSH